MTKIKKNSLSGFMLIELIVATLIASMVSTVLLTALYQGNKVQAFVDDLISTSERIAIVANQLEKDLAGSFVPVQAEEGDIEEALSAGEKPDTSQAAQGGQKEGQKKQAKPIEKIFYSTNKNGMLDTLSFVTNNPLVVFVGKDVGTVKPKVVRVQYTVKPEQGIKDSYALFRQEGNELDLADYKNVRPYEIIGGIKKITVSFTARLEKKEEKKAEQKSHDKQKISYEYKVQPEWISEQKKDKNKQADQKQEPEFPRIPYAVEFKITLWDKLHTKDEEFTIVCEIPVDSLHAQQENEQQPQQEKKVEPKSEKPENKPNKPGQMVARNGNVGNPMVTKETVVIETLTNTLGSLTKLLKSM